MPRCPGQDMRYWTPKDIFDVECPFCGVSVEFWKDEPSRICRGCHKEMRNPRIDLGCAKWCQYGAQCLGHALESDETVAPLVEKLLLLLKSRYGADSLFYLRITETHRIANLLLVSEGGGPCVVKAASLLVGLVDDAEDGDAAAAVRSALAECAAPQDVIERIVSAATSVANASPESLEDAIVRDAFILTGTELSSGDAVNIRTEGGRLILQRKLSIAAS